MILSIVALGIIALIAYIWMLRGFFSALLHLVCVVVAGAIAFALWEPVSYLILDNAPGERSFFRWIGPTAWAVGLVVPFAGSLLLLRMAVDRAIPANATTGNIGDRVGGAVCGALSGVITSGILVLSLGMLWLQPGWLGYQRLTWNGATANVETTGRLWVPVDEIVAGFYGRLSETTLAAGTPLSVAYPHLSDVPHAMRLTVDDGAGRPTFTGRDFSVSGAFTVGLDDQWQHLGEDPRGFLLDTFNPTTKDVTDRKGESLVREGSYIAGYALTFDRSASEPGSGQVVIGGTQVRLLVRHSQSGEIRELFPISVVTRTDSAEVSYARHRYSDGFFPASTTEASPKMAFEFMVPQGYRPQWLYVKNYREDVSNRQYRRFTSRHDREQAMLDRSIIEEGAVQLDEGDAQVVRVPAERFDLRTLGININDTLGRDSVIRDGAQRSLITNDAKEITGGQASYSPEEIRGNRALPKELRIDRFAVTRGNGLVQVQITPDSRVPNPAVNITEPPLADAPRNEPISLVGTSGTRYPAIGFIYEDRRKIDIRYTRSERLEGLTDLPSIPSRSRRDQNITLLFEVMHGDSIRGVAVGDKMYVAFQPPAAVERR